MAEEQTALTGSKALITIGTMLGALVAFIDISIVNVALTDIRATFGTPLSEISWVSTSYMMANVSVIPLSGWLQRRFGYRHYFVASLFLFTVASLCCGLAWNLGSLMVFRTLQGLGGGAIIPSSQAILFLRYPKAKHGLASAFFGLGAITGPLVGPYLGGTIIDASTWRWIFLVNIPVGLLAAALIWNSLREPGFRAERSKIDAWGIVLLTTGLLSLQYVLEEGNREDWFESPLMVLLAVVAVIMLCTFVVHEFEVDHPIVDLRLFQSKSYAACTLINFLVGICVFAGSFLFSLFCGGVLRYSALDIGVLLLEGNLVMLILMPVMGRVVEKVDGRWFIALGILLMSGGLWMNARMNTDADSGTLLSPLLLRAFGIAFAFVPLLPYALSDVPPARRGDASALFNLTRELGGSIGIAWMTTSLDNRMKEYASHIGEHVDRFQWTSIMEAGKVGAYLHGRVPDSASATLAVLKLRIDRQALSTAFNDNFMVLSVVFVLSLLLLVFLKAPAEGVSAGAGH